MNYYLLIAMAVICFVQNMFFTASSRSRNSGNPLYHLKIALGSNGVWFLNRIFSLSLILDSLMKQEWTNVFIVAIVYSIFTSAGSATMMWYMIKHEKGNKRVGAKNV